METVTMSPDAGKRSNDDANGYLNVVGFEISSLIDAGTPYYHPTTSTCLLLERLLPYISIYILTEHNLSHYDEEDMGFKFNCPVLFERKR
ncbi:hypothetical protein YC2023_063016 [Brassica napus]